MKSKKGAFANSATGYGKRHHSSHSHTKSTNKSTTKSAEDTSATNNNNKKSKKFEQEVEKPIAEDDNDLNSGFGNYLRSNEGIEMMKIFVFANTVMVAVTIAWPQFKAQYFWFVQWLESFIN